MKLFSCSCCSQVLSFENTSCVGCGHRLGYTPDGDAMVVLEGGGDGATWQEACGTGRTFRFCRNAEHDVCNWLIAPEDPNPFCAACRHNRQVPDISLPANLMHWRQIEFAKHRLIYSLRHLGLPLPLPGEIAEPLVFSFLADDPNGGTAKVMTGHEDGLITIALAEADDAERERRRAEMGEPYRTLIGHFRHEVGHYYWDRLVRDGGQLEACRAVFGDDSEDYQAALQRHYKEGPPPNWTESFISAYATTHAWEDFAETWSHYLHIVDTLEMAKSCGLSTAPAVRPGTLSVVADVDPYREPSIDRIIDVWLPVAFAMNSVNRCMGQGDLYPFILSPKVIEKLGFIHRLVHDAG